MLKRIWIILFSFSVLGALPTFASDENLEAAVVFITNYEQVPNWNAPWEMQVESVAGTGSGFLIDDQLILTNAHVVSNSRLLLVNNGVDPEPAVANVVAIAHDSDLALIQVEDSTFYEGMSPLTLGELPELRSRVRAYGYSAGGQRLSRTEGVVSRIEFGTYIHSGVDAHLIIQTDSAINPGNSGGPAVQNGKVVGVAFQSSPDLNDVGYFIPVPLIKRFLSDVEDHSYDGVPEIGVQTSDSLNRYHRRFLKLPDEMSGVMIEQIMPRSSADGKLFVGDVLVAIEEDPIDNAGRVSYGGHLISFYIRAEDKQVGDLLHLTIWRDEQLHQVQLVLKPPPGSQELRNSYNTLPQYVVFGGLVFMKLSRDFLKAQAKNKLALIYEHFFRPTEFPDADHQDVIVLSRVLPAPSNSGYAHLENYVVHSLNGVPVRSLQSLKDRLSSDKENPFFVLSSKWNSTLVVLDRNELEKDHDMVLERYGILRAENL